MTKLTSDAIEVINRNALVSVALNQGYNAFLPRLRQRHRLAVPNSRPNPQPVVCKARTICRLSFDGGRPKKREYSRLNWVGLS
jgi:hypothetical protein